MLGFGVMLSGRVMMRKLFVATEATNSLLLPVSLAVNSRQTPLHSALQGPLIPCLTATRPKRPSPLHLSIYTTPPQATIGEPDSASGKKPRGFLYEKRCLGALARRSTAGFRFPSRRTPTTPASGGGYSEPERGTKRTATPASPKLNPKPSISGAEKRGLDIPGQSSGNSKVESGVVSTTATEAKGTGGVVVSNLSGTEERAEEEQRLGGQVGDERVEIVYVYCHGFLSGPESKKGTWLKKELREKFGIDLLLLDLNGPEKDPAAISPDTSLEALKRAVGLVDEGGDGATERKKKIKKRLRIVGSSLGGYVAALFASKYPEYVDRLSLLCPAFDMESRWNESWGRDFLKTWKRKGSQVFQRGREEAKEGENPGKSEEIEVPYRFVEEWTNENVCPPFPSTNSVPTVLIHGTKDKVVDYSTSTRYVATLSEARDEANATTREAGAAQNVMLQLVPDSHDLHRPETLSGILKTVAWQWELQEKETEAIAKPYLSPSPAPLQRNLEVERKFMVPEEMQENTEAIVKRAGGTLTAVQSFTDRYWDVRDSWPLARNSCWLRKRGGIWELKVPQSIPSQETQNGKDSDEGSGAAFGQADVYEELLGATKIYHYMRKRWKQQFNTESEEGDDTSVISDEELETWLRSHGFSVYAEYQTRREKYRVEGGVDVDFDCTDYGSSKFTVMEIEKVVGSPEEIPSAETELEAIASRILSQLNVDKGAEQTEEEKAGPVSKDKTAAETGAKGSGPETDLAEGKVQASRKEELEHPSLTISALNPPKSGPEGERNEEVDPKEPNSDSSPGHSPKPEPKPTPTDPDSIPRGKLTEYILRYEPELFDILANLPKFAILNRLKPEAEGSGQDDTAKPRTLTQTLTETLTGAKKGRGGEKEKEQKMRGGIGGKKSISWFQLTDRDLGGFEAWARQNGIRTGPVAHGVLRMGKEKEKSSALTDGTEQLNQKKTEDAPSANPKLNPGPSRSESKVRGEREGGEKNATEKVTPPPVPLRGLFARQHIKAGQLLAEVPSTVVLRTDEGESCPEDLVDKYEYIWQNYDKWYVKLGVKLLSEQLKGEESDLKGYISLLPEKIDETAPVIWSEQQIQKGFGYYRPFQESIKRQRTLWDEIAREIHQRSPEFSPYQLKRAFYLCLSRAFKGDFGRPLWQAFVPGLVLLQEALGTEAATYVLLPQIDSHNHNSTYTTDLEWLPRKSAFELRSDREYAPGDQVFISYGKLDNDNLLARFGFVEKDNPYDQIRIAKEELEHALGVVISRPELDNGVVLKRDGTLKDEESIFPVLAQVAQGNGQARAAMRKVVKKLVKEIENYGSVLPQHMEDSRSRASISETFRAEKLRLLKEALERFNNN